jgi:hypothetical protein
MPGGLFEMYNGVKLFWVFCCFILEFFVEVKKWVTKIKNF